MHARAVLYSLFWADDFMMNFFELKLLPQVIINIQSGFVQSLNCRLSLAITVKCDAVQFVQSIM